MARLIAAPAVEGLPLTIGEATLWALDPGPVTHVAPFRGAALPFAMPAPGRVSPWNGARLVPVGPGRALLLGIAAPDLPGAALTDQGDGLACVALEGPAARDVLARLVPIDLREAAFPDGACARTLLGHMAVTLLRAGEAFEVLAMRSMADTLVHEIAAAMRGVAARARGGAARA